MSWAAGVRAQELSDKLSSVRIKEEKKPIPPSDNYKPSTTPPKEVEPEKSEKEKKDEDPSEERDLSKAEKSLLSKITRTKLVQVNSEAAIEIERQNPFSPLHSVKSFQALHLKPELLKGIYNMGYRAPSKIQETALPVLLADPPQNMIAQSQSGTGKTAAFTLAMLSRVDVAKTYPQVLCLAPTYELAIQIGEVAATMSKYIIGIKIRLAVRGEDLPRGVKITEHIVIGTPGKVLDWAIKLNFFDLNKLTVFVLDEADVMIATQGHKDQSYRIRRKLSDHCQMLLFSATYDDDVMSFARGIVPQAVTIRLKREEESLDNIKQYYTLCDSEKDKYKAIANIYASITVGQAMIFCQTRRTAAWLADKLTNDGHAVALLSGELSIEERIAILDRFREGKERVLITTNVLARGIDIEQVTMVVNFNLPVTKEGKVDCETYLHRIGRTGRFGKVGLALNLVTMAERDHQLKVIENHFQRTIHYLDTEECEELDRL